MTDETKAVARAIMEAKGGCIVKDWQAERRDNPHVELAWNQAQAATPALALCAAALRAKESSDGK